MVARLGTGFRPAVHDENRVSSLDEIIELYMRDVDVTLIEASLRRSIEERIQALEQFAEFLQHVRTTTDSAGDAVQ